MLGVVFFENTKGEGEAYWVRVVSKVGHTEKGYYIKLKCKFCDFFLVSLISLFMERLITPEQAFEPETSDQKEPGLFTMIGWRESGVVVVDFSRWLIHKDIVGRSDQVSAESWHGHSVVYGALTLLTNCPIIF